MKIAVVFGSQRKGGTHGKIEEMLLGLNSPHAFDFIRMAEMRIESCTACESCGKTGHCVLPAGPTDMFQNVLDRLIGADAILIATPVYAPIPSRLAALFERLMCVSYFTHITGMFERPLKGKKTAVVSYDSGGIADDTPIKMIFQISLTDHCGLEHMANDFVNMETNPKEKYHGDIVEYVKEIVRAL